VTKKVPGVEEAFVMLELYTSQTKFCTALILLGDTYDGLVSQSQGGAGRRRVTPSKGDRRERAILDAAEEQLRTVESGDITVESIARAAGITRGALYFYFGSKNDVLTALVQRTTDGLRRDVEAAGTASGSPLIDATSRTDSVAVLRRALERTQTAWQDHGSVMRAAVELSAAVPAIEASWRATVDATTDTLTFLALASGLPDGPAATDAPAVVGTLVWMTERAFYQASRAGSPALSEVAASCMLIWSRTLGLSDSPRA
jgi:AcrR family transcriptional regulator